MSKFYSFILLLSVVSLNSTQCMISEFKYEPWVQCPNDELLKKRHSDEVCCDPNIETRKPNEQEQTWKCFNYAVYKTTGSITPLQLNAIEEDSGVIKTMASIDIEKLFDQIEGPEEGALVLYTDNVNRIQHFAVVIDNLIFESKWGVYDIRQHKPFDVPSYYGDRVSFWKLKETFTTMEGRKLLLETIKKDAEDFDKKYQQLLQSGKVKPWDAQLAQFDKETQLLLQSGQITQNEQAFSYYKAIALGVVLGIGGLFIIDWLKK
ncbi:MAG TPA: hypothetical protein VJ201_01505 [Candidatus Babeliales bacterium]|nr:hypothetical protein [Candidatus Babeliales bacterium]